MPQALQSGVPSSASLHSGVLLTLHDAHVLAAAAAVAAGDTRLTRPGAHPTCTGWPKKLHISICLMLE